MRMVTVSSGAIAIQQVISGARLSGARRLGKRDGEAERQPAGRGAGGDKKRPAIKIAAAGHEIPPVYSVRRSETRTADSATTSFSRC